MANKTSASMTVLPAGSDPVVSSMDAGTYDFTFGTVTLTEGRTFVEITYPDGWKREHHVIDAADLASKIINNLRARFGVESVSIVSLPKELEAGAILTVEV